MSRFIVMLTGLTVLYGDSHACDGQELVRLEKSPLHMEEEPFEIKEGGSLLGGGIRGGVNWVAVSPTRKLIAASGSFVRVWDEKSGEIVADLKVFKRLVGRIAFSADGRYLATMGWREPLRIFEVQGWKVFREAEMSVRDGVFLKKRNVLAVEFGYQVRFYDVEKGEVTATIDTDLKAVSRITLSHDDALLAVGDPYGTVQVYDIKERKLLHTIEANKGPIYGIAFSDDGQLLAIGGNWTKIKIWDVKGRKFIREWEPREIGVVSQVVFLPGSRQLAVTGTDNRIHMYDAQTWRKTTVLRTDFDSLATCVAFYPDGDQAVAGCRNGTVRWWKSVERPKASKP